MNEIAETGYWTGQTAHIHHVHSKPLSEWIIMYMKGKETELIWDLGCGLGNYLKELTDAGFTNCIGIEGDPPTKAIFDKILRYDITNPLLFTQQGNVICLEVLEHIPANFTNQVLQNIQLLCNDTLILSWAIRDQPGFGHVNCLNNNEVIPMIEKLGFVFLPEDTNSARSIIDETTPWFKNTLLIFKKVKNDKLE